MKPLNISQDIVSLSEFKKMTSKLLRDVQKSRRPLVITQNGKAAAVLVSPADFDLLSEHTRIVNSIQRGISDVKNGRIYPDEDLDRQL